MVFGDFLLELSASFAAIPTFLTAEKFSWVRAFYFLVTGMTSMGVQPGSKRDQFRLHRRFCKATYSNRNLESPSAVIVQDFLNTLEKESLELLFPLHRPLWQAHRTDSGGEGK